MRSPGRPSRGHWSRCCYRVRCDRWQWKGSVCWLRSVRWLQRGRWQWKGSVCWLRSVRWLQRGRWQWKGSVCWLRSVRWLQRGRWQWKGSVCWLRCGRWTGRGSIRRIGCWRRNRRVGWIGRRCGFRRVGRFRCPQLYCGRLIANYRRFGSAQSGEHTGRRCGGWSRLHSRAAAGRQHHHRQCAGCDS